jgi:hypothetical protein
LKIIAFFGRMYIIKAGRVQVCHPGEGSFSTL